LLELWGARPCSTEETATNNTQDEHVAVSDRAALLVAQRGYLKRLHRAADDFEATRGLKLVNAALQDLPAERPVVTTAST